MIDFLSGVGLFLLGLVLISENISTFIKYETSLSVNCYALKPAKSFGMGLLLSLLCQSSSCVNSLTINMNDKKILSLKSSTFIIMGANIGTTITPYFVALSDFNLSAIFSGMLLPMVLIFMISKKEKHKLLVLSIIGFSTLFVGIHLVSNGLPFAMGFIEKAILGTQNALYLFVIAILATSILQSSSLVMVMLISIVKLGTLDLTTAFYIIIGLNIGTCSTVLLASIGKNVEAKRLTMFNLKFNILGAIIVFIIIFATPLVDLFSKINVPSSIKLAIFHTLFNVVTTFCLFPFADILTFTNKELFHILSKKSLP